MASEISPATESSFDDHNEAVEAHGTRDGISRKRALSGVAFETQHLAKTAEEEDTAESSLIAIPSEVRIKILEYLLSSDQP